MREDLEPFGEIARGSLLLLVARTTFFACGLLTSIILSRLLGPVEFGVYGLVFTLVTWLQVMLTGGIAGATTQLLTENPDRRRAVEATAVTVLILFGALLFLCGYLVSAPLTQLFGAPAAAPALRIAFLDLPIMALVGALQGGLYASARYGFLAFGIAAHGLLKVGGIAALALIEALSVEAAFLVHVASSLILLALLLLAAPPRHLLPAFDLARALVRRAWPLALYIGVAQLHLNLPLWLLAAILPGSAAIGFYVAALNLGRTLILVPAALSGVVFAAISGAVADRDRERARRQLASGLRLALLLLAPAVVLVAIEAEPLITFLFGEGYREGAAILPWQMVAFSLFALSDVLFNALFATGASAVPGLGLVGLVVPASLLCLLLVPSWGAVGAGVAHALAMSSALVLALLLAARCFGTLPLWANLARIMAATLSAGLVSFLLPAHSGWLLLELPFCFAVYVGGLVLIRELRRTDLAVLPFPSPRRRRPVPSAPPRSASADGLACARAPRSDP